MTTVIMPMESRKHMLKMDLLLLLVTFFWGITFIIVKQAIFYTDVFVFLFVRFGMAFLLMCALFRKGIWPVSAKTLRAGIYLGILLFAAFALQTWGLIYTSATNGAFLTGLNVVFVPLLTFLILKRTPAPLVTVGIIFAFAGLYVLTGGGPSAWNRGDLLVFICAIWVALHIMLTGYYATRYDTLALATWQVGTVSILSIFFSLGTGTFTLVMPLSVWSAVGVTAIFCTVLAYAVQTHAQRYTPPARTALIFTAEPVFGALFAHWYGGEALYPHHLIGGSLIFLGMILAEIRPKFWGRINGSGKIVPSAHPKATR